MLKKLIVAFVCVCLLGLVGWMMQYDYQQQVKEEERRAKVRQMVVNYQEELFNRLLETTKERDELVHQKKMRELKEKLGAIKHP